MTATAQPSQRSPWLLGPLPDLLLGCGVGYALVLAALAAAGPTVRAAIPFEYGPLVLLLSGTPHYGATLLRVYERSEDRRAYALFAVWISALIALAFVAALRWPVVGSLLLTLMLTWSPWHYTGQNYGIALMFLRRAGVPIAPGLKRLIYASFFLSFGLTVLAVHGAVPSGQYAPTGFGGSAYRFLPLGIPDAWRSAGFAVLGAGWLATALAAAVALLRLARPRLLAPALVILVTQALWFVVPTLARHYGIGTGVEPLGFEHVAYAFLWVAVAHSVQYLWVSSYYARQRQAADGGLAYYGRCILAGAALWTLPALAFPSGFLGAPPYDLGLAVLVSAVVNLHHFVLDGAIWKLRDGRVARFLLRTEPASPDAVPIGPARRLRPAWLVWAMGAVCVLVIAGATLEGERGFRRALERGDAAAAEASLRRLSWIGRDSPVLRVSLATVRARGGDFEHAVQDMERALSDYPTPDAWRVKGWILQLRGDWAGALAAYEEAWRLDPGSWESANNLAWLRATCPNALLRDPPRALELAKSAARSTAFGQPSTLDTLAAAYAAALRFPAAVRFGERAVELARAAGDPGLADVIAARVALYRGGQPYVESVQAAATAAAEAAPLRRVHRLQ